MYRNEYSLIIECTKKNLDINLINKISEELDIELLKNAMKWHKLDAMVIFRLYEHKLNNRALRSYIDSSQPYLKEYIDNAFDKTYLVHKALVDEKISCVILKGPAYYLNIYNDKYIRRFSDADILISTSDIIKAHRTMLSLGYKVFHPEKNLDESDLVKLSKTTEHLFGYYDSKMDFRIEFHHVYDEWLYNRILIDHNCVNGLNIPNLVDMFFISCYHAWQHFDHYDNAVKYLNLANQLKLRQLTDIYYSFNKLKDNNLLSAAKSILMGSPFEFIVYKMLSLANMIYPDLEIEELTNTVYEFDWNFMNYCSKSIKRLFEPKEEYDRIYRHYKVALDNGIGLKVPCYFRGQKRKNPTILFSTHGETPNFFWKNHLNHSRYPKDSETKVSFSISWDFQCFAFDALVTNDTHNIAMFNHEGFEENAVWLGFGMSRDSLPIGIKVMLNQNKPHSILRIEYGESGKVISELDETHGLNLHVETIEKGYHFSLSIPWREINIIPSAGLIVLFDLSIDFGQGSLCESLSWAGGRGARYDSCLTFAEIKLES